MVYRPIIAYTSYGANADPLYGNPRTLRITGQTELAVNWADGFTIWQPTPDINGSAIVSALYWDLNITTNVANLSKAQKVVSINVKRNMFAFKVSETPLRVSLTVTWVFKKNGAWLWNMAVQEVDTTLVISAA